MTIRPVLLLALGVCAALGMGGCGGGSDASASAEPTVDTVPASASDSVQSFADFAKNQKPTDVIEPLQLQQLLPPISDTTEPFAVGS